MRPVMLLCALMLSLILAPLDRSALAGDLAIQDVISEQIAAFQRDDGAAAWSHASPGIRTLYPTPGEFAAMVRKGYAPCYAPRHITFRELLADNTGAPVQMVELVGPDGLVYLAHYRMERQADGSWKISAVWLERLEGGIS